MKKLKPAVFPIPEDKPLRVRKESEFQERLLIAMGEGYRLERTKSVVNIIPHNKKVRGCRFFLKGLDTKDLLFIKKVKKHIRGLPFPDRFRKWGTNTYYFRNSKKLEVGIYSGVCEIDVNSAYWKCAKDLGYINKDLYEEGNDPERVSKKTRLMALGSCAKKTEIKEVYFQDGELKEDFTITEEPTEVFWDNITFTFGNAMNEVYSIFESDMFGFWVDAVFCRTASAAKVRQTFTKMGYPVKLVRLDKIEVVKTDNNKVKIIRYLSDGRVKELPPFDPDEEERKQGYTNARKDFWDEVDKEVKRRKVVL